MYDEDSRSYEVRGRCHGPRSRDAVATSNRSAAAAAAAAAAVVLLAWPVETGGRG